MRQSTMDKVVSMGAQSRNAVVVDADIIRDEFTRVQSRAPGVTLMLLSTADGRSIADWTHAQLDPRRIAAMTNTFLTLGETLAKELGMNAADHATVSTGQGSMVVIRIHGARPYTLAVSGARDATLAVLLFAARECAARIRTLL